MYTDAKANYLLTGALYDANSKTNLTELRQRARNRVAFDSLPLELRSRGSRATASASSRSSRC
jgi:hypothetical protein